MIRKMLVLGLLMLTLAHSTLAGEGARVLQAKGSPQALKSLNQAQGEVLTVGMQVAEGAILRTGVGDFLALELADGSSLKIAASTTVQLRESKAADPARGEDRVVRLKLFVGRILAKVKKAMSRQSTFNIEGSNAVCGVRGTTVSGSTGPEGDEFCNYEGTIEVDSGKGPRDVPPGPTVSPTGW